MVSFKIANIGLGTVCRFSLSGYKGNAINDIFGALLHIKIILEKVCNKKGKSVLSLFAFSIDHFSERN